MLRILLVSVVFMVMQGCAVTKWECASYNCMPREQATNRCLAQANTAYGSADMKSNIWAQCMRGEGFREVKCQQHEIDYSYCQVQGFHVR